MHSVRDTFTLKMLNSIGINNVINTSCPSVWSLNEEHCKTIPVEKSESVLFTLTDYKKNPDQDLIFIDELFRSYSNIFFWPQGIGDIDYLSSLNIDMNLINLLNPSLSSLDTTLEKNNIDYIGTRLHAGIRSIQFKKRSLILSVDNRAWEIAKDINLNVTKRGNLDQIRKFISQDFQTMIYPPFNNIQLWKNQFTKV